MSTTTQTRFIRRAKLIAAIAAGAAALKGVATVTLRVDAADQNPAKIGGQPNLNGVWQAMGTADWNLEAHSAQKIEGFYGSARSPRSRRTKRRRRDGKIPYKPEALAKRNENRASGRRAIRK